MTQIEEIKSKLDIVEVIREYVPVKAVGANFQALCPFHNEKTPSFVISPEKQIWHCFGCARGGDVFSFVMEKEALAFPEALRLLAAKAGVTLRQEKNENLSRRNRLLDILELSAKYYAHLLQSPAGRGARDYVSGRGLSAGEMEDWQIGYSPDSWSQLYDFLKQRPLAGQRYTDEEIAAAGLVIPKKDGRGYYDRFRSRVMFPIRDLNGHVIAFTARVSPEKEKTEKLGKYINSPQTAVYDKSRVLFGLDKAKVAMRDQDLAIVVEGQMDVIACHRHGFKNVVASSGTALTAEQVSLIKRFTGNVALLFDMDQAGQLAADRGIREVLAQELNLSVIVLEGYKDPDDCLRQKPEDFAQAVAAARPMLEYYFDKVSRGQDLEKMEVRRAIRDQMFEMISLVVNKTEQGAWLKRISEELGYFEPDTREEFLKWQARQSVARTGASAGREEVSPAAPLDRREVLGGALLALLIRFPEFVPYVADNLRADELVEEQARFYKEFIIYYNKFASTDYDPLRLHLAERAPGAERLLDKLVLLGERDYYSHESAQVKAEILSIISDLKRIRQQEEIKKLQRAIAQAEKDGDNERASALMEELSNLMNA